MQCPFLNEARVAQCSCSTVRKVVLRSAHAGGERCSSPDYVRCSVFAPQADPAAPGAESCPYLYESPMQYCSAAPVIKYIRYSESLVSRCGTDAHRYCDAYLALAGANREPGEQRVGDVRMPPRLRFAPNHMWLDPGDSETWHVGIDGFLASVLGAVDRVSFLTMAGYANPAVVLTQRGVDLQMVFPHRMLITGTHNYLRARPDALTSDPYGQGWLFEGRGPQPAHLLEGAAAEHWMQGEVDRLSERAHAHAARRSPGAPADGGSFAPDLLDHLGRDEIMTLFHEFFSPCRKPEMPA